MPLGHVILLAMLFYSKKFLSVNLGSLHAKGPIPKRNFLINLVYYLELWPVKLGKSAAQSASNIPES